MRLKVELAATKTLRVHKGKDEVTLLTCTGQGNTMRFLVTGGA